MTECYSVKAEGECLLSENFKVKEFACRDGSDAVFIDEKLIEVLQAIRERIDCPLYINSGYRTPSHNRICNGATYSQHLYGRAADVRAEGVDISRLAEIAEELLPDTGGIGCYPVCEGRSVGWLHIDTRRKKSRWTL